jgi:FAD:protein FMN transferase
MRHDRRSFLNLVRQGRPPTADQCWLHVNRSAMACRFEVTMPMSQQFGVVVATEALDEIDRLEAQLTVFRESSEISYINRNAATEVVTVESSLFDLLLLCQELHRETEGAFDVTSTPLTRCWGFLRRQGRLPNLQEIEKARNYVGFNKVLLDSDAHRIRFSEPGVEINLGSIGKGYALDRIAALIESQIESALLNAGASSMRAVGAGERGEGWTVGLRHPRSRLRRLGVLRLRDCSMSTSGSEEQFFEHEGRRFGHIIDPRTGFPADSVTSVTVVAQSAAVSDALATAFYVGGRELAERYCSVHPEVLVIMLENNSKTPIIIGHNSQCDGPSDF